MAAKEQKKKIEPVALLLDSAAILVLIFLLIYFVVPKEGLEEPVRCSSCGQLSDCNLQCTWNCVYKGYTYIIYSGNTTREGISCFCVCNDFLSYFKK